MLLHYVKSALRRLGVDRFFAFVNLVGLSIGLASVVAISLFVAGELAHDRWLPEHARLFRVDTVETMPGRGSIPIFSPASGGASSLLLRARDRAVSIHRLRMMR